MKCVVMVTWPRSGRRMLVSPENFLMKEKM
jgi:hypothetical protein